MKQIDVRELENRRETLEAQIHKIERRGMHMTPEEHLRAAELKKRRLLTKDWLRTLGRG
ncbi:MAG: YdcH family protein [Polyangiaceae bacterium]|jgi:hypothetical protein